MIRLWRSPTLRSAAGFVPPVWYGWSMLLRERHAKPDRTWEIAWGAAAFYVTARHLRLPAVVAAATP